LRNKELKFSTLDPAICPSEVLELNTNTSGLVSALYEVIPQNPLMQPVNAVVVIPVYVIISLSILSNP